MMEGTYLYDTNFKEGLCVNVGVKKLGKKPKRTNCSTTELQPESFKECRAGGIRTRDLSVKSRSNAFVRHQKFKPDNAC